MSKYTEAIEFLEHLEGKDLEFSWTDSGITELLKARDLAVETLEIADRLEQVDVISNEEIYIKACRRYGCWESECPHRARDRFCSDLAEIFFDGYDQALADLRGDKDGIEMRDATNQEKESVSAYIKSISEDTGFNFFR